MVVVNGSILPSGLGESMLQRFILMGVVGAFLACGPSQSHAQVSAVLLKCTKSVSVAVTCVIIDGGVAKAVDIAWDKLIALAFGGDKKVGPDDTQPSKATVADVEANGIAWDKLQEFLVSVLKSTPNVDGAQARQKVAASCAEDYAPVCRYLGVPEPNRVVDCSKITTQEACEVIFACSWKGSACARNGGTKDLLKR